MPFDPYRRELGQEKRVFILVSVLFFNLILISTQITLKGRQPLLVYVAARVFSPLQVGIQKTADFFSSTLQRYVFLKGMYKKYQLEKKKNLLLRRENFALKGDLREQSVQKKAERTFQRFVLSHVILVDPNFPYHTVVIDRGRSSGIKGDLPVVNLDGDLVGKTIEPVTGITATVRLMTSAIGGAGAYLEANMFEGFLTGNNSGTCDFKYLLENKPVKVGERVITSGSDMIFPSHLPIGTVIAVEKGYLMPRVQVRPYFLGKPIKDLVVLLK